MRKIPNTLPGNIIPLHLPMPGFFGSIICYLVKSQSEITLIDTGMNDLSTLKVLKKKLEEQGLELRDIDKVAITHFHPDHCGLAAKIQAEGAKILMSKLAATGLEKYFSTNNHDSLTGCELDRKRSVFYGEHKLDDGFGDVVNKTFTQLRKIHAFVKPDEILEKGKCELSNSEFTIINTPGHTDCHICIVDEKNGIVFSGDHILGETSVHIAPEQEMTGNDALGQYMTSLGLTSQLSGMSGYGGHGSPVADIAVRSQKLLKIHNEKIEKVLNSLTDTPTGLVDISQKAMNKRRTPISKWFATSSVLSCLQHLVFKRLVQETRVGNYKAYLSKN